MDRLDEMKEGLHKSKSGLIRALVKTDKGSITDVILSGDYILTPEHCIDDMEKALIGTECSREKIIGKLKEFYEQNIFQSPQTYPEDFTEALMKAINAENG
jgi:hypothetical protein